MSDSVFFFSNGFSFIYWLKKALNRIKLKSDDSSNGISSDAAEHWSVQTPYLDQSKPTSRIQAGPSAVHPNAPSDYGEVKNKKLLCYA